MNKQRLSKTLAGAGVGSRRQCEEIIFAGRVKVNGEVILLPQHHVDANDKISVDDERIRGTEKKVYFILNKPPGYVCTNENNTSKRRVLDLFQEVNKRLFTVGRLDKYTTGLLIVTNDGQFANRVIHPRYNIHKEYLVKTNKEITIEHLQAISKGIIIENVFVKPVRVQKVRKGTLKIVVSEGKKREVRRMVESIGLPVKELTRIRIGGLHLGKLPLGAWRPMTEKEKQQLFDHETVLK